MHQVCLCMIFSTLQSTLHHYRIKEKKNDLNEKPFHMEGSCFLACNGSHAFSTSEKHINYT